MTKKEWVIFAFMAVVAVAAIWWLGVGWPQR